MACYRTVSRRAERKTFLDPVPTCDWLRRICEGLQYSAQKSDDREFLSAANGSRHELRLFEPHLSEETAGLAAGFEAVCVFVNDQR
jgi:hypothetical protein